MAEILKSSIDNRIYRALKLSNSLECLLISDSEADMSGACMTVNVGSLEDPFERQGLAHFCEHMLFMGTEKFPDEAEYDEYISKNSGSTNAFTDKQITAYMFDVSNAAFEGALDRFAQFFISPLFSQSCTDREMNAVNSEFNKNIQYDTRRAYQLINNQAKDGNPYQKFSTGNIETLKFDDTRQVNKFLQQYAQQYLLKFHEKYYSANQMKLILYGQESIEQLTLLATNHFEKIQNKQIEAPVYKEIPFNQDNFSKFIKQASIKDEAYLMLIWLIDNQLPHYKQSPGKYISHLLGHEGENSLLSFLIDEGLAFGNNINLYNKIELSSWSDDEMSLFSFLNVSIKLTKKGEENIEKLISFIYSYLQMLKQKGVQKWIFDEIKEVDELTFAFLEKEKPFDYVTRIGEQVFKYPLGDILKVDYFMENFEPDLLQKTIESLTEKNVMIIYRSKELSGKLDLKEKYYGTEYSISAIPGNIIMAMQNCQIVPEITKKKLDLPVPNIFVPKCVALLDLPQNGQKYPYKLLENEQIDLWFKRDTLFKVPKAIITIRISCKDLGLGLVPETAVLLSIWMELLDDYLRELNYLAQMAKIDTVTSDAIDGINVQISGFNDTLKKYCSQYFQKIKAFNVQDFHNQFENKRSNVQQSLENFFRKSPYQQIHSWNSYQEVLLRQGGCYDPIQMIEAVKQITFKDLQIFQSKWLQKIRFTSLIMGNIQEQDAKEILIEVSQIFKSEVLLKDQCLEIRPVKLTSGKIWNFSYELKEPTETNSAVVLHFQNNLETLKNQLINGNFQKFKNYFCLEFLQNIIKEAFFQQLRTVEQLGYVVFSSIKSLASNYGLFGMSFVIQSNAKCPQYVQDRIRTFLKDQMYQKIKDMTNDFETFRESLKVLIQEQDYSLLEESQRYWKEIKYHNYIFDRKERLLELIPLIQQEEVIAFYEDYFINNPRVLEIHAIAPVHVQENEELKKNIKFQTQFASTPSILKRQLPLLKDQFFN